jgi:hypothetical protein
MKAQVTKKKLCITELGFRPSSYWMDAYQNFLHCNWRFPCLKIEGIIKVSLRGISTCSNLHQTRLIGILPRAIAIEGFNNVLHVISDYQCHVWKGKKWQKMSFWRQVGNISTSFEYLNLSLAGKPGTSSLWLFSTCCLSESVKVTEANIILLSFHLMTRIRLLQLHAPVLQLNEHVQDAYRKESLHHVASLRNIVVVHLRRRQSTIVCYNWSRLRMAAT